jgi:hypothetical protein
VSKSKRRGDGAERAAKEGEQGGRVCKLENTGRAEGEGLDE